MEKILEQAKELGRAIQADERFLKLKAASEAADADGDLQKMIGEFNLKRMAISEEAAKPAEEQSLEKQQELNKEIQTLYMQIMQMPAMQAYEMAKTEMDKLANGVMTILNMSMQGVDPDTYEEGQGCSGNCGSCGGCH